jgi:hypothetical protein
MRYLLPALTCFLFYSCNSSHTDNAQSFLDSLNEAKHIDTIYNDRMKEAFLSDTLLISGAPVQVISTKVVYGGAVKLKYKNVSGKDISAVRFLWYGEDAFFNPIDLGSVLPGAGGGYSSKSLAAGGIDEGYWSSENEKLKTIIKAWPVEVAFSDNTKWKIK